MALEPEQPLGGSVRGGPGTALWIWAALLVPGLAFVSFLWFLTRDLDRPDPSVVLPSVVLPNDTYLDDETLAVAISPDGQDLVLTLRNGMHTALYHRPLGRAELRPLKGTEDARGAFFSPNGAWIGYIARGKLLKVPLEGGSPIELTDAQWGAGTWTADGRIIYTRSLADGLRSLPDSGGEPTTLTEPDRDGGEIGHGWPQVLPDGEHALYTAFATPSQQARIRAVSLQTGEIRTLVEGAAFGRFAASGHLVFLRSETLMAVPFDPGSLEVRGAAAPLLEVVPLDAPDGSCQVAFSENGALAWVPARTPSPARELHVRLDWFDELRRRAPPDAGS